MTHFGLQESMGRRWARRAISFSFLAATVALYTALLPVLGAIAFVIDVIRRFMGVRGWPLLRFLVFVGVWLWAEWGGLWLAGLLFVLYGGGLGALRAAFLYANFRIQIGWTSLLFGAARRIYNVGLEVEGLESVAPGPVLILIRHVSTADTVLPSVLVSRGLGLWLRFVLKRELLWDPCLDVVGQRIPNVFVRRGADNTEAELVGVRALASGLSKTEGVLIFPEGTRFSQARRARILERRRAQGDEVAVALSERLTNVLPPRWGGIEAVLAADANMDVVFCAHTGLEGARQLGDFWHGRLIGRTIRIRFWREPRSHIPKEPSERRRWLGQQWCKVNDFVDEVRVDK